MKVYTHKRSSKKTWILVIPTMIFVASFLLIYFFNKPESDLEEIAIETTSYSNIESLSGIDLEHKTIIFKNVNLVSMTNEDIIENKSVLVRDGQIISISDFEQMEFDQGITEIIDGRGKFLMPGLADMHVHALSGGPFSSLKLFLANGVTTIRDLGNSREIQNWKNQVEQLQRVGPTIYASSPIIFGDKPNASKRVALYQDKDCIKLYNFFTEETFSKTMKAAQEQGVYAIGHIPFALGLDGVIKYGMNEIAHIQEISFEFANIDKNLTPDGKWYQKLLGIFKNRAPSRSQWYNHLFSSLKKKYGKVSNPHSEQFQEEIKIEAKNLVNKLKGKDIAVTSTIIVDKTIRDKVLFADDFIKKEQNKYLPPNFVSNLANKRDQHVITFNGINEQMALVWYEITKAVLVELFKANIPIILGTDSSTPMGVIPGFSVHEELQILTENGLSPYESIKTATKNAGIIIEKMTGKNETGTIEVGKRADMILVNSNPLENVANIKDNSGVMANGVWYNSNTLNNLISYNNKSTINYYEAIKELNNKNDDSLLLIFLNDEKNEPYFKDAYQLLVDYYKKTKQPAKMKNIVGPALEFMKNDAMAINNFCWYIFQNKMEENYDEAIKYVLISIEMDADEYQVWDTLACLYYVNGQTDKAITAMKKTVELSNGEKSFKQKLKKMENGNF